MHDVLVSTDQPLNQIAMSQLCPGATALDAINQRLR
jgi:hypothetical protein